MRKTLEVIKLENNMTEFRVNGRHVMLLQNLSFEQVRQRAYRYVWNRPEYMWTIRGSVA